MEKRHRMGFIEDFDKIRERFTALWNREILDRCCISVFAYDQQAMADFSSMPPGMDPRVWMTDPEIMQKRHLQLFEKTYFAGDAFPLVNLNLGPSGHTAFIQDVSPKYEADTNTIWYSPIMEEELEPEKILFDKNAYLYTQTLACARFLTAHADGKYLVSMPDLAGNLDVLSNLRTPTELAADLISDEETVEECLDRIEMIWETAVRECYEVLRKQEGAADGSCIGWLNTWAPGFHNQMQVDMSVMFSNDCYERFARKELERQSSLLDYALYHLDGVEQLRHLDTLLSIPDLRMIQWTNVAGQPSRLQYIPAFKKMQEAGKCLLILCETYEVETLLTELSSKGLLLNVKVGSREEADAMVRLAEKLTHE